MLGGYSPAVDGVRDSFVRAFIDAQIKGRYERSAEARRCLFPDQHLVMREARVHAYIETRIVMLYQNARHRSEPMLQCSLERIRASDYNMP